MFINKSSLFFSQPVFVVNFKAKNISQNKKLLVQNSIYLNAPIRAVK